MKQKIIGYILVAGKRKLRYLDGNMDRTTIMEYEISNKPYIFESKQQADDTLEEIIDSLENPRNYSNNFTVEIQDSRTKSTIKRLRCEPSYITIR